MDTERLQQGITETKANNLAHFTLNVVIKQHKRPGDTSSPEGWFPFEVASKNPYALLVLVEAALASGVVKQADMLTPSGKLVATWGK